MRLLQSGGDANLGFVAFNDDEVPAYAILSHTWGADVDEVTFEDLKEGTGKNKAGYKKLDFCRKRAISDGIRYFWIDTCCINKSSSTELSVAINSMFDWYRKAEKCYAYLSDVSSTAPTVDTQPLPTSLEAALRRSRWFCRGWTLQELIASPSVEFYSGEGILLGSKRSLETVIHEITGIAIEALRGRPMAQFSIAERLAWAEHRQTKRQEDKVYSLLGLFNIYMPPLYGEGGDKAFQRLQKKIYDSLKRKYSLQSLLQVLTSLYVASVAQLTDPIAPSSILPLRRNPDFVDRRTHQDDGTVLEQIEQLCTAPAARVSLVGIGGVGKSQLAIEYCYRVHERSPGVWIFWIDASNNDRIEQGFREVAEQIKIPGARNPRADPLELVMRWLRDEIRERWMLVLDNLDDDVVVSTPQAALSSPESTEHDGEPHRPLSAYLPQSQNGTILITTRTENRANVPAWKDIVPVEPMTNAEAIELLQKKLGGVREKQDLIELASLLTYMPLAIVQAAGYIQQKGTKYSVRQYIETLQTNERKKSSLLRYKTNQIWRDLDATDSIILALQTSFDDIREKWPASADLLSLMSYFDPQSIPYEVLRYRLPKRNTMTTTKQKRDDAKADTNVRHQENEDAVASESSNGDMFEEALARLQSYSFVLIRRDERTSKIHGIVQRAIRNWLELQGVEETWKALFCRTLNAALPTIDYENWDLYEELYPHVKFAEREPPTDPEVVREWAQILRKAAWFAWSRGNYAEAARMCGRSVEALKTSTESGEVELSYSLEQLASIYQSQARWTEAEKIGMEVMKTRSIWLGHEHPETLTSIANLASTYRSQSRWAEAEKMETQVMELRRKMLGVEHPDTLASTANLASAYHNQGRAEAEEMFMLVMNTSWRVLGREHPLTLTSMASLASIYRNEGRWKDAEDLELQVVETFRKAMGPEHPSTISSIANLASTYRDQGRWEEARELQVQVMEANLKVAGPDHPDTLSSMANLASTLWNQGRWLEAEEMELQVMEKTKSALGPEHPDTLTSVANLASTYQIQGRLAEAEKLEVEVLEMRRKVLGEEHPSTLSSTANLASTYRNQGRLREAEKMEAMVMKTRRRVLGEDHPDTLRSMANLAIDYSEAGKGPEALELSERVWKLQKDVLGEDHRSTLKSMHNLAIQYGMAGREAESLELTERVLMVRKVKFGEDHPDTLSSINNLAVQYSEAGRRKEALEMLERLLKLQKSKLGEDHPDTLASMANLGITYSDAGQRNKALELTERVVELYKDKLGEDHPDTLRSMSNLANRYSEAGRRGEALELTERVVELYKDKLGEDLPDILSSSRPLAYLKEKTEEYLPKSPPEPPPRTSASQPKQYRMAKFWRKVRS